MIRIENELDVYLLRHAEAYKNLAKVHGGGDQRLTPTGVRQAQTAGRFLVDACSNIEGLRILHQPEERSKSTAANIGLVAARPIVEVPELIGVRQGVVSGLSEKEIEEQYPEVAAALVAWRTNKGDLGKRPHVPGSEPMEEFAERIQRGLFSNIQACNPGDSLAIVGTTSTLNMLNHLLVNDGDFIRPQYDFVEFPLGSLAAWRVGDESPVQILPITVPPPSGAV